MIRGVRWFLAGIVITLAVLYAVLQSPHGRRLLLALIPHRMGMLGAPGSGSHIRVVGGSITVQLSKPLTFSSTSKNHLSVQNADSTTFQLTNVSQDPAGGPNNVICPSPACPLPAGSWTIVEYVIDSMRGVRIVGPGTPSGTVTFDTENPVDSLSMWPFGWLVKQRYFNDNNQNPLNCAGDQCEMVDKFVITPPGGSQGTWYCRDPEHYCDANIGPQ